MPTTHQDQDKSKGKPRQRSRKADQRGPKPEQRPSPKLDSVDEAQMPLVAASVEASVSDTAPPVDAPLIGEVLPPSVPSVGAITPAIDRPISIQIFANAYADGALKSLEQSSSFVEKFIAVRSFEQAIEVQTDFARQAYANFIAESQKMCELYVEFARQMFRPWERLAAKASQAGRQAS
jgi:Phasin protein